MVLLVLCRDVQAQRPFDGTDAAVVGKGRFELEAGASRRRGAGIDSIALPSLTGTYGPSADTEVAFSSQLQRDAEASATRRRGALSDTELTAKHVLLQGALQGSAGPSVAIQCSLLLAGADGPRGLGETCAAVASGRWKGATAHVDLGLERSSDRAVARSVDLMVEGVQAWTLTPVAELVAESDHGGNQLRSALVGLVYRSRSGLSLDVALRHARASSGDFNEVRMGVTLDFEPRH